MESDNQFQEDLLESILEEYGGHSANRDKAGTEKEESNSGPLLSSDSPVTQVDRNWRQRSWTNDIMKTENSSRQLFTGVSSPVTQVDRNWRNPVKTENKAGATKVEIGWRDRPSNYSDIHEFQKAAAALTNIRSGRKSYSVERPLSDKGGESAVLLCRDETENTVVTKIFSDFSKSESIIKSRAPILDYMKTEDGKKYTLAVIDTGYVSIGGRDYYFEVTPFCPEGDLSGKSFTVEELIPIIDHLNEALNSLHSFPPKGILHRDIKPENLFYYDGNIVIGDFGVAKLANTGATQHRVGTTGFTAPEVLMTITDEDRVVFDDKTDYYSLGVTLACLFEGKFIYKDMPSAAMADAVKKGKPPLTKRDSLREQFENLIYGLVRYDPAYRFGYEDVRKWLENHEYKGVVHNDVWDKAFTTTDRQEFLEEKGLSEYFLENQAHWEEAKDYLFAGEFYHFFCSFRPDIAKASRDASENYRSNRDKGVAVFLKSLNPYAPIAWKGYTFARIDELAERMKNARTPTGYGEILSQRLVSDWVKSTPGLHVPEDTLQTIEEIERFAETEPEIACYWFGLSFSHSREFMFSGNPVNSLDDLFQELFGDTKKFYSQYYEMLRDQKKGAVLFGYFYSLGYRETFEKTWAEIEKETEINQFAAILSIIDEIGDHYQADCQLIRGFFAFRGPLAICTYVRKLVTKEKATYKALDANGQKVLDRIAKHDIKRDQPCSQIFRDAQDLVQDVRMMRSMLTDNPFLLSAGTYEESGIICTNLKGCFGYRFLGSEAPLGLKQYIE